MTQWVLSVAGIAILSVLADVILPNGQTRKYIKTVIGVVVTLVLVQPLLSLSAKREIAAEVVEVSPQQQYLDYVEEAPQKEAKQLQEALAAAGFDASVVFSANTHQFVATLGCPCTAENRINAEQAAKGTKCSYSVKFVWDD